MRTEQNDRYIFETAGIDPAIVALEKGWTEVHVRRYRRWLGLVPTDPQPIIVQRQQTAPCIEIEILKRLGLVSGPPWQFSTQGRIKLRALLSPEAAMPILDLKGLVGRTMKEVQRDFVLATVDRCNGNKTHASAMLEMSLKTVRAWTQKGASTTD